MTRILLAEADALIAAYLVKGARRYGLEATVTDDGREALLLVSSGAYDLLVVDSRLPNRESLEALRHWDDRLPIVVLSGSGRAAAETAEEFGVPPDDVLAKPFRFRQLVARISAHLGPSSYDDPSVLRIGQASLDLRTRVLTLGHKKLALTAVEFALAAAFFRHPGRMISGEELLRDREAQQAGAGALSAEDHLNELNRKLGRDLIRKVYRDAYRLEVGDDSGPIS